MHQFLVYNGTIKLRRNLGLELREAHERLDGCSGGFLVLWQMEADDSRYPNEYAMRPFDGDVKRIADEIGASWIASGDIDFSFHLSGADISTFINFGSMPFEIDSDLKSPDTR